MESVLPFLPVFSTATPHQTARVNRRSKMALPCTLSSFRVFYVFVWTGDKDLKTLRVDANYFENGGKRLILKRKPMRVDGALRELSTGSTRAVFSLHAL